MIPGVRPAPMKKLFVISVLPVNAPEPICVPFLNILRVLLALQNA